MSERGRWIGVAVLAALVPVGLLVTQVRGYYGAGSVRESLRDDPVLAVLGEALGPGREVPPLDVCEFSTVSDKARVNIAYDVERPPVEVVGDVKEALTLNGWEVHWTRHERSIGPEITITGDNPMRHGHSVWITVDASESGSEVQVSLDGGPTVSCFVARLLPG